MGLGLALAKQLIQKDLYMLVLTARATSCSRFQLGRIEPGMNLWIRELDVTNQKQVKKILDEIRFKLGGVDILINNAGVIERATVEDSSHSSRQGQLEINYLGPFDLVEQVLPGMRQRRSGKIFNVSSAGGFMAMPTLSAYSASKFALEGASEALWYEMRPWGVSVTLVIPGFINSMAYLKTRQTEKSAMSSIDPSRTYFRHYEGMRLLIQRSMSGAMATNEQVAERIIRLFEVKDPPLRVYVTIEAKLFYLLRRILPPAIYHQLLSRLIPGRRHWGRPHSPQMLGPIVLERRWRSWRLVRFLLTKFRVAKKNQDNEDKEKIMDIMNSNISKGKWLELKGELHKAWGQITDDELESTKGDLQALMGLIQARYGVTQESLKGRLTELYSQFSVKKDEAISQMKEDWSN